MLLTVLLFSGALFILLVAGLINGIFEYFKEKKLRAELEKNQKTIISLNSQLNNSMDRNLDYLNENAEFHEDIIKLKKENVELRNSNNDLLNGNYHLKDTNTKLNNENIFLRKKIETLEMKVECQESFVRGANMAYEALSAACPNLFKPDVPTSTTVVVEEVEEEIKNDLKLT